jgi:ABC-type multidrug transport system fused ATPase/permease subunit
MSEEAEFSWKYLSYYLALGILGDFFLFYKNVPLIEAGALHTNKLHALMTEKVIGARINTFFDIVPIGRILQRFNGDLEKLGVNTGFFFSWLITTIFDLISGYLMFTYVSSIYSAPFIVAFIIAAMRCRSKFLSLNREIKRLISITKGPVIDLFSEVLQALPSIRAFDC